MIISICTNKKWVLNMQWRKIYPVRSNPAQTAGEHRFINRFLHLRILLFHEMQLLWVMLTHAELILDTIPQRLWWTDRIFSSCLSIPATDMEQVGLGGKGHCRTRVWGGDPTNPTRTCPICPGSRRKGLSRWTSSSHSVCTTIGWMYGVFSKNLLTFKNIHATNTAQTIVILKGKPLRKTSACFQEWGVGAGHFVTDGNAVDGAEGSIYFPSLAWFYKESVGI